MSDRNVELVRRYIDRLNRGDWISAGTEFTSEDVEIDWSRSPAPYRGIYRGREAALKFGADLDVWESARIVPADFIDAGEDVLVPHVAHLKGRDGIEVEVRSTYVFTVRDDLCVRWRIYQEHDEALEDLGLAQ